MHIVIEGLDATGKSTLAKAIASEYNLPIQESEGPPKSPGEFAMRIERYLDMPPTIFVRHPCVSNPIYDVGRDPAKVVQISSVLMKEFYSQPNSFIYCDPSQIAVKHEIKEHDSEEHLRMIKAHRNRMLIEYRKWAMKHAHFIYRIGDNTEALVASLGFRL